METSNSISICFELAPVPASRPRVSKFGTYYAKGYKDWLKGAGEFVPQLPSPMFPEGPLGVSIEVICKKPKTTKSAIPVGDVDNYAKGPLDVITKAGLWGDDKQVVKMAIYKRYAEADESPKTTVKIVAINPEDVL